MLPYCVRCTFHSDHLETTPPDVGTWVLLEIDLSSKYLYSALQARGEFYLYSERLQAAESAFQEVLSATAFIEQAPQLAALAQYGLAQIAAAHGRVQEAQQLGKTCLRALMVGEHFKAVEVKRWLEQYHYTSPL